MKNFLVFKNLVFLFCSLEILIGIMVLLGWTFDITVFKTPIPNQLTVKVNTAVAIIVSGFAILLLSSKARKFYFHYIAFCLGLLTLCIAVLTLLEYLFQIDLGMEFLVLANESQAGKMSPTTAFCFINMGIAILFAAQHDKFPFRKPIIEACCTTVIIIAGIILLSYLPNLLFNYHILTSASMGIYTSIALILLGFALLIHLYTEIKFFWTINSFITFVFFIGLILIICGSDAYKNFTNRILTNDAMLIQHQRILKKMNAIAVSFTALEINKYNYLMTKTPQFLTNTLNYQNTINALLIELDKMTPDISNLKTIINKLKYSINKKIDLKNAYKEDLLSKDLLIQLQAETDNLFDEYIQKQNASINLSAILSPLGIFSFIALLSIGFFLVNTGLQQRNKMNSIRLKLAEIVNSSDDAIISKNLNGIVTSWNKGAESIFGYSAKEILGQPISILFPPDSQDEESNIIKRITNDERIKHFETVRKRKDGKLINVSITISPLKNTKNEIIGASKIVRDITNQKRLEQQLRQTTKMGAIGQLSGGIAHDFNNLLGIIIGNLDLLSRSVVNNESDFKRVTTALNAATRGAELTKRLLAFSRQQPLAPKPTDINISVTNLVQMATQLVGKDIQISTDLSSSLPLVNVDTAELESALLNLIVNARDAMPQGGRVIIATNLRELDTTYLSVQSNEISQGVYVALSVTDTGHGIPPDIMDRVFEPFFTTKERGKGTGMGLAMVYGFANQSGGTVKIYSEVGHGTTITIFLPLAEELPITSNEPIKIQSSAIKHKVLLVDDEPDLLEIASEYLRDSGYEIYQATNGKSALEIFERTPGITLLITDVIMPGEINGIKLAEKVRQLNSDIFIIYVSGFPLGLLSEKKSTTIDGVFLRKPYQRDELLKTIRTVEGIQKE